MIQVATILAQIEAAPGLDRLRALSPTFAQADADTVAAVLYEAARFCADHLTPINAVGDRDGCLLVDGRVRMPAGYADAWRAYVAAGWPTLDHPIELGGQGLPLFLAATVQQLVDSSCAAFGMLPVLQRSAARLIAAHGSEAMRAEWLAPLVSGEWAATICISEAHAGSDAGRLRTRATPVEDGSWSITGDKMWISFGDHDLTPRIGHCLLARTEKGLSLFLVPGDIPGQEGAMRRNAITVTRLEEKLGLHGSPTCALAFENAKGWLIGAEGRGLQQMFVMITNMRLSAGVQGLGLAAMATDIAYAYAAERRQGGSPSDPPVVIDQHADVQRMLLDMSSAVETVRGLGLAIAVHADLAAVDDAATRETSSALIQWLLPIFKTIGGECGFDVASQAVQVLGGAGYTREWPVEQLLRDARIATIYEGTTGVQALDLLHRRLWRDNGAGLTVFLSIAEDDLAVVAEPCRTQAIECVDLLKDAATQLTALQSSPREAEAGATAFLHLAGLAALAWIAARLSALPQDRPHSRPLRDAGRYALSDLPDLARLQHARAVRGAASLDMFGHRP